MKQTLSNRLFPARAWLFLPAIAQLAGCTGDRTVRGSGRPGGSPPDGEGDSAATGDLDSGDSALGLGQLEVSAAGAIDDAGVLLLDLGGVPVFASATARFTLRNVGTGPLTIRSVGYVTGTVAGSDRLGPRRP